MRTKRTKNTCEKYYKFLVYISEQKDKIDFEKEFRIWRMNKTFVTILRERNLIKDNKWNYIKPTKELAESIRHELNMRVNVIRKQSKKQNEIPFPMENEKKIIVVKKPTEQDCIEYLKATGKYKIYKITTEEI